jgi:putative chitinase
VINRTFFFDEAKLSLFDGKMSKKQVEGLNVILDEWEKTHAKKDDRWLAYALGTTHHETGRTMQPIHEWGTKKYFTEMYDPPPTGLRPKVAAQLGNTQKGDGPLFAGRGFVQLTGRGNYTNWKKKLGVDLVGNPDLAMDAKVAVRIMFEGMEEGSFTGKKFGDYFNKTTEDWKNARRIINALNRRISSRRTRVSTTQRSATFS